MSIEESIITLIGPAVDGRIWWDTPPDGFNQKLAFIIVQQVGGEERWYVDQVTAPSHRNSRLQFNLYSPSKLESTSIEALATVLRESGWVVQPLGAPVSGYEPALKLYEMRQDFAIWHPVSP